MLRSSCGSQYENTIAKRYQRFSVVAKGPGTRGLGGLERSAGPTSPLLHFDDPEVAKINRPSNEMLAERDLLAQHTSIRL
jgi:hypothetical protein